ncbi:MAG: bifunctional proline dehydrogenase/L-glutamate gamma-semialdehyde dehydrogenase [Ilumatobacteraceae bacterium]
MDERDAWQRWARQDPAMRSWFGGGVPSAPASTHAPSSEPTAPALDDQRLADEAVAVARRLLERSTSATNRRERRRQERLARLIDDTHGRELVFALTDEVIRIDDDARAADRFAGVVAQHRDARLGPVDRILLAVGARVGRIMPGVVMPLVRRRIAAETRGVILPAENRRLHRHLEQRQEEGVRLIVNPLGEAVLSDQDAQDRVDRVLAMIARDDVDYVSVKISALVADLDVLAFEHSVQRICERLREIHRAAQAATPRTFVNLDMEEYDDLDLSVESFMRVLDEPEFADIDAGIVLQAYVPDSHLVLDRLGAWAAARHQATGGRVKVRIVKGANLAMERAEAEVHGWEAAPYGSKSEVDASYKALLDSALRSDWADALVVGVASHNLFDIAWALVTARHVGALERVEFEMLEGMAPAQARAVQEFAGRLLMYAPVVDSGDFDASIAYLARRLDENTQPENFLRSVFDLQPDTPEWDEQEERFRRAVRDRHAVATWRHRRPRTHPAGAGSFHNEPDSDFTDALVRRAALAVTAPAVDVTPVTTDDEIDAVLERAQAAFGRWATKPSFERRASIRRVTEEMRRSRFETIAVMAAETGKTIREGDAEVSEAIDFGDYYSGPGIDLLDEIGDSGVSVSGRGVVGVVGPWNFPYAIPAGGVFAALSAGNAVVLKPAPESVQVAAQFIDQVHRAGIDPDLVQLVVCEDGPVGRHLVTDDRVDTIVLTGSYETAELFLGWKPNLRLFAETSGKNALVITAAADLDLALDDLVHSAFGHAGQKCSAASLAIVEATVYDDPDFHRRLRDVVLSRRVGWPHDPSTVVGPVIAEPSGNLHRALTTLEAGERWLVAPKRLDDTGRLWRPGVRVDVQPGSWFHRTECFGPVLGVIRARDLDHAIAIQNDSAYGLTGGIHSLDPAEVERWCDQVQVGNGYVNRRITGAVVQRQPFGGWKRSSVGPGAKAGGPSYVLQFSRFEEDRPVDPEVVDESYERAWRSHFSVDHDPSGLLSESNVLRYRPVGRVVVRHDGSRAEALRRCWVAARLSGVELVTSHAFEESEEAFVAGLRDTDRVRLLGDVTTVRPALVQRSIWCDDRSPVADGRVELLGWVREQAISRTLHRHGRVPASS